MHGQKAQLAHPLNWILVLVAGAFFLFLFIAILKLMTGTDDNLSSIKTLGRVEGIIDESQANPGTISTYDFPELITRCEANNPFTIELSGQTREYPAHILFSPETLKGPTQVWSEELRFPAPIGTLTYLYPENTLVLLVDAAQNIPQEVKDQLPLQKRELVLADLENYDTRGYDLVIVLAAINLNGKKLNTRANVHGITIDPAPSAKDHGSVTFYDFDGEFKNPSISSYLTKELFFAALFAGSQERYECAQQTLIERMQFLLALEEERIKQIKTGAWPEKCALVYERLTPDNTDIYPLLRNEIAANEFTHYETLQNYRTQLLIQQNALRKEGCPALR